MEDATCPSCGSPVEIDSSADYLVCDYCGSLIEVNGGDIEAVINDG